MPDGFVILLANRGSKTAHRRRSCSFLENRPAYVGEPLKREARPDPLRDGRVLFDQVSGGRVRTFSARLCSRCAS
jgi:hypothetical protein